MKVIDFFQAWQDLDKKMGRHVSLEQVHESVLQGFPVRAVSIDDVKFSEKALSYLVKFRLGIGEKYVIIRVTNDVGRFILEHVTKRFDSIGLRMENDEAVDCVLVYHK